MDHLSFFFQINLINCKEQCSAQGKMTVDNLKMTSEMTKLCSQRDFYSLTEEGIHKCM